MKQRLQIMCLAILTQSEVFLDGPRSNLDAFAQQLVSGDLFIAISEKFIYKFDPLLLLTMLADFDLVDRTIQLDT